MKRKNDAHIGSYRDFKNMTYENTLSMTDGEEKDFYVVG